MIGQATHRRPIVPERWDLLPGQQGGEQTQLVAGNGLLAPDAGFLAIPDLARVLRFDVADGLIEPANFQTTVGANEIVSHSNPARHDFRRGFLPPKMVGTG